MHPGGRCYGYTNVPIEDPSRQGKYGRPAVSGVSLEINAEEAAVLRRIFQMYASGSSLAGIAKTLNAEGILAPQPGRNRPLRAWGPSSIREILRNERYRGVNVWNRTAKHRNPETGRKVSRRRPKSEWVRVAVPEWRIISEELWNGVQAAIKEKQRFGNARCGGMNRTEESRRYLFSGILRCGKCSSRMVIVSGRGKRGYAKYGCPSHRYRGICENTLTIRQERLEEQLLGALEQRVLRPEILDYTLRKFREQLRKRLDEIRKQGSARNSTLSDLHRERRELQEKAMRVSNAIAEAGHSPTLLAHLALIESEQARVEQRIEAHRPVDLNTTEEEIREFATRNVLHLRTLLRGDVTHARMALMQHVGQLVLMPRQTSTGPMFEVSGAMNLLGEKDVMLMVARDGIEPPTPAFSGLLTDNDKPCVFNKSY